MKKIAKLKKKSKKITANHVKLSALIKQQILSTFVDELVQKKIKFTKKQSRVDSSEYESTLLKIQIAGINWVTLKSLKFRVLRAFKAVKMSCPPPPGSLSNSNDTSSTSTPQPLLPYDRQPNTSNNEKDEELAQNEITLAYSQKYKICQH